MLSFCRGASKSHIYPTSNVSGSIETCAPICSILLGSEKYFVEIGVLKEYTFCKKVTVPSGVNVRAIASTSALKIRMGV